MLYNLAYFNGDDWLISALLTDNIFYRGVLSEFLVAAGLETHSKVGRLYARGEVGRCRSYNSVARPMLRWNVLLVTLPVIGS